MDHYYHFFDRDFFDPIWKLTWEEYLRKYKNPWASRKTAASDEYDPLLSLRGLIAFCLEPEPSRQTVENILATRTVRWTAAQTVNPSFFLSEMMSNVLRSHGKYYRIDEIHNASILISAALSGYFTNHISGSTLLAVLKLHNSAHAEEWVEGLSTKQSKLVAALTMNVDMLKPTYRWQSEDAYQREEWTNSLNIAETRRFISFVAKAWRDNWPLLPFRKNLLRSEQYDNNGKTHFKDFQLSRRFQQVCSRAARFNRPTLFRSWE